MHARPIASLFILPVLLAAQPVHAQVTTDEYFDSDGVRIRYVEAGEGDPVVLIHGFTANVEFMWQLPGVMAALAKDYRVIAMDCRGHGKSDKPHDADAYGKVMAEDVVRLLDHLEIKKAHLVGYSMGGMITFRVLADHPERVISALPCGFGWAPPAEDDDAMMESLASALENDGSIRPLMEFLVGDGGDLNDEQIEQIDQMIRMMNDTRALAAVARGMNDLRPDDVRLEKNEVPTLAIVGTADPLHLGVLSMQERMKNLDVKLIDGGDHMSTFADEEFLSSVRSFLATHAVKKTEKK